MREIKFVGLEMRGNDKRNYRYSLFKCSFCESEVIKKTKDGKDQAHCSHKCYAKNRRPRGAYKEKVEISGYLYIYQPSHPKSTKNGYVAEHRLVAEKKLGRYLTSDEVAHHKNRDKHDNDAKNITVMTRSEHNRLHARERERDSYGMFTV